MRDYSELSINVSYSFQSVIMVHSTEPWMKPKVFMAFCEAFPAQVSMTKEIQKKITHGIHIKCMQIPGIPFQ